MAKIDVMNNAAKRKDDEFYSTSATVEYFFKLIDPDALRGKKVWLPFDSEKSEFTKWFENPENKAKWGWNEFRNTSDDFFRRDDMMEWCDIAVSNPPFSKEFEITEVFKSAGKDFVLICPQCKVCTAFFGKGLYAANLPGTSGQPSAFNRPDGLTKRVNWCVVSNDAGLLTKTQKQFIDRNRDFAGAVDAGLLKKTDPLSNGWPLEYAGREFWHCVSASDVPAGFCEPVFVNPIQFCYVNSSVHDKFDIIDASCYRTVMRVEGKAQYDRILVRRRK